MIYKLNFSFLCFILISACTWCKYESRKEVINEILSEQVALQFNGNYRKLLLESTLFEDELSFHYFSNLELNKFGTVGVQIIGFKKSKHIIPECITVDSLYFDTVCTREFGSTELPGIKTYDDGNYHYNNSIFVFTHSNDVTISNSGFMEFNCREVFLGTSKTKLNMKIMLDNAHHHYFCFRRFENYLTLVIVEMRINEYNNTEILNNLFEDKNVTIHPRLNF